MIRMSRLWLALAIFSLTLSLNLQAADLAGVTMPDSVQVGNTTLVLNGLGLRTKIVVKVYVAGLYLPENPPTPTESPKLTPPSASSCSSCAT